MTFWCPCIQRENSQKTIRSGKSEINVEAWMWEGCVTKNVKFRKGIFSKQQIYVFVYFFFKIHILPNTNESKTNSGITIMYWPIRRSFSRPVYLFRLFVTFINQKTIWLVEKKLLKFGICSFRICNKLLKSQSKKHTCVES